ncbi:MAG: tetratricopeptide repeat protein [Candidatus Thorarchaeota archaeon]
MKLEEKISRLLYQARSHETKGDWGKSICLLEQGINVVGDDTRLRTRLLPPLAGLLWKRGKMAMAEELLSEAMTTTGSIDDERFLPEVYYQLGEIQYVKQFYMDDSESDKALPFHEKALELRLRLDDMEGASDSHSRVGTVHERLGDWEKAHQHYRKAIRIAEEIGYTQGLTRPLTHLGGRHRRQGEIQRAFEQYQEALRVSQESGNQEDVMFSLANVAQMIHRVNGDPEEALDHCQRALEIAERTGFKLAMARVHYGIAVIHLGEEDFDQAREHFRRVIEISEGAELSYFIEPAKEQLLKIEKEYTHQ